MAKHKKGNPNVIPDTEILDVALREAASILITAYSILGIRGKGTATVTSKGREYKISFEDTTEARKANG
ncbi:MAG TPA: hypothetical protein VD996_02550 [Chitinophagaceae bacterium]|nr:hypothetical protein [Chitinophagaceae bacterium]